MEALVYKDKKMLRRGYTTGTCAALAAQGETLIRDCHHIERGYEDICRDMAALGADIRWLDK